MSKTPTLTSADPDRAVLAECQRQRAEIERLRGALEKTGDRIVTMLEGEKCACYDRDPDDPCSTCLDRQALDAARAALSGESQGVERE